MRWVRNSALVAVVLLLCAALYRHQQATPSVVTNRLQGSNPAAAPKASPAVAVLTGSELRTIPGWLDGPRMALPPQDVPLRTVFPELERAARAGDVGAMCRLAYELQRCTDKLKGERRLIARMEFNLRNPDLEAEAEYAKTDPQFAKSRMAFFEQRQARLETMEQVCEGIRIPPDLAAWQLLRDAARAGHVPSMLRFAREFPLRSQDVLDHLEELAAYRDEAPVFLQRAGESGDPRGAQAMFWALRGQSGAMIVPGFKPIERNDRLALAYAIALREVVDAKGGESLARTEARLRRKLSNEDEAAALQLSQPIALRLAPSRGANLPFRLGEGVKAAEDCSN